LAITLVRWLSLVRRLGRVSIVREDVDVEGEVLEIDEIVVVGVVD